MNAQELYELVKGHEDVWANSLEWDARVWRDKWGNSRSLSNGIAEAALIGLFAVATGCGLKEFPAEGTHPGGFAAFVWNEGAADVLGHGPSRLAALVRAREAGKERGE
jgi:hypothetical protein